MADSHHVKQRITYRYKYRFFNKKHTAEPFRPIAIFLFLPTDNKLAILWLESTDESKSVSVNIELMLF